MSNLLYVLSTVCTMHSEFLDEVITNIELCISERNLTDSYFFDVRYWKVRLLVGWLVSRSEGLSILIS